MAEPENEHDQGQFMKRKPRSLIRKALVTGVVLGLATLLLGLTTLSLGPCQACGSTVPISELMGGVVRLDAAAILSLGILLIIATPSVGVISITIEFAGQRDYAFVLISGLVLAMILAGYAFATS